MVKRTVKGNNEEPEQKKFKMPSEIEHLFQVVDVHDIDNAPNGLNINDPDIVFVKLEVCGGGEEGRTTFLRLSLNHDFGGFFSTRLFLKSISEPYKGDNFDIDTDNWIGRQMYATIIHNESNGKVYANIEEYNFEKIVEQCAPPATSNTEVLTETVKAWDE